MTEENTQAVVTETETAPSAAVEGTGAQKDDLASFLDQYEQQTRSNNSPNPAQPVTAPITSDPVIAELKAKVDSWELKEAQVKSEAEESALRKQLIGNHDLPEEWAEVYIRKIARENPKINGVYNNRENDPAEWNKARSLLKKGFDAYVKEKIGKPVDAEATGDRVAVTAAVRGASNRAPESATPKLGNMTNHQFNEWVKENHGYHPGV